LESELGLQLEGLRLAFVFQKPALAFDTAAVSGERTVGSDHSVTGDDNADGVRTVGEANCPDRGGPADLLGEFCV
jgi:hypothetical protein